jgi:hypothetical protein
LKNRRRNVVVVVARILDYDNDNEQRRRSRFLVPALPGWVCLAVNVVGIFDQSLNGAQRFLSPRPST